ncbi:FlgN family protein [Desulforamulus profundi]|uniref:FlgN family protein n=1 Tax=Desulforamulus profundi TaxID=1383067 RepID=A0A2C6MCK0_9FIRM|nr:flagellar protein FlgN [Desulforamulus profundi]MCL4439037.1 flagellar protein FlgN [Bacillota bacterium]PHJ37302.1 FlgN family protein [Desulforamulus profundi]
MESLFFNLLQVLNELNDKLAEMLKATEKHNLALRNNDIEAIKEAVKELENVSAGAKFLDKKREEIQYTLEQKLQLPKGATLSETISYAPEQLSKDLHTAAQSLRETTNTINDMVQLSKILAKQALNFNDVLLKVMKPAQSTYNPAGKTAANQQSASLLNKTV